MLRQDIGIERHVLELDLEYQKYDHPVYKYRLLTSIAVQIGLVGKTIRHRYFSIDANGWLSIHSGYCWDGASGPTIDCAQSQRASLVHDVLYQALRSGELLHFKYNKKLHKAHRKHADKVFYKILAADGMNKIRAWYYYKGVRMFGGKHALPRYM